MLSEREKSYHLGRAQAEMDLGYRAEHRAAAAAHLRLSALHMSRIKDLDETCEGASAKPMR